MGDSCQPIDESTNIYWGRLSAASWMALISLVSNAALIYLLNRHHSSRARNNYNHSPLKKPLLEENEVCTLHSTEFPHTANLTQDDGDGPMMPLRPSEGSFETHESDRIAIRRATGPSPMAMSQSGLAAHEEEEGMGGSLTSVVSFGTADEHVGGDYVEYNDAEESERGFTSHRAMRADSMPWQSLPRVSDSHGVKAEPCYEEKEVEEENRIHGEHHEYRSITAGLLSVMAFCSMLLDIMILIQSMMAMVAVYGLDKCPGTGDNTCNMPGSSFLKVCKETHTLLVFTFTLEESCLVLVAIHLSLRISEARQTPSPTQYSIAFSVLVALLVGWAYFVDAFFDGKHVWNCGACTYDDTNKNLHFLYLPEAFIQLAIYASACHAFYALCKDPHPAIKRHIRRLLGYLIVTIVVNFAHYFLWYLGFKSPRGVALEGTLSSSKGFLNLIAFLVSARLLQTGNFGEFDPRFLDLQVRFGDSVSSIRDINGQPKKMDGKEWRAAQEIKIRESHRALQENLHERCVLWMQKQTLHDEEMRGTLTHRCFRHVMNNGGGDTAVELADVIDLIAPGNEQAFDSAMEHAFSKW